MRIDIVSSVKKKVDSDLLLLQAIADPTRLAILRQLASTGATCACDLTGCCGVSQPTTSHHLKVLREAGWIAGERRGTWIWYSIRPEAIERLTDLAAQISPSGPGAGTTLAAHSPLKVIQPV